MANRPRAPAFFVAVCCLVVCLGDPVAARAQRTGLSPGEQAEYERIKKRLRDHEGLLNATSWTLCHCAEEREIKKLETTLSLFPAFDDPGQIPRLVEAGGIKGVKTRIANLLKNRDPVVRGFGAVLLAVIGHNASEADIARLLEDKRGSPAEDEKWLYNYDRSRAAMALGLMGAKKYAPRLSELLRSPDEDDRAGAALGLGYMGAKEYIDDLAKLLADDKDPVQIAAMQALAELDAKKCARDIAGLLTSGGDPMVSETACYVLARLNAKEQAKELAALLEDEFRKGDAAKALALLGASRYGKQIAQLAEDGEPLIRCDAMIALAILDADQYADRVAAHLHDQEAFVRAYAATALLIMGDRTHSKDIVAVVRSEWRLPEIASDRPDPTAYFAARIDLHPAVAERQRQLTIRAAKEWERLNRSENGLQGAPADADKPRR